MNRYAEWYETNLQQNFQTSKFFQNTQIPILDVQIFIDCNKREFGWVNECLKFNNQHVQECLVPRTYLWPCEIGSLTQQIGALLLGYDTEIIGCLLLGWDLPVNTNFVMCFIYGRNKFENPMLIDNAAMETKDEIAYLDLTNPQWISVTETPIPYDEDLLHNIGFVVHEANLSLAGDYAGMGVFRGMLNFSGAYRCLHCKSTKKIEEKLPNPRNRKWVSRTLGDDQVHALKFANTHCTAVAARGITQMPLARVEPYIFSNGTLHTIEGITARIINVIWEELKSADKSIERGEILNLQIDISKLETQICNMVHCQNFVRQETNSGYRQKNLTQHDLLSTQLSNEYDNKLENLQNLQNELHEKKQIYTHENPADEFIEILQRHNICIWHYHRNSIAGPDAKKILENVADLLVPVRKANEVMANWAEPLLMKLAFLADMHWKKNYFPFDDDILDEICRITIEWEYMYNKFMNRFDSGTRYGAKPHFLYHCYEFAKYHKFSSAWLDEQRVEHFNKVVKNFWNCFGKVFTRGQMLKMVNKMNRHVLLDF